MKMLIVDDEYSSRKALSKILREWNSSIVITDDVGTGQDAISCIEKEIPDIVFTDIRMPEMDGLELSKYIQNNYPSIITVIISGYAEFEYAQKAINYNVKKYLLKPIDKRKVWKTLKIIHKELTDIKLKERQRIIINKNNLNSDKLVFDDIINGLIYNHKEDVDELKNILNRDLYLNKDYYIFILQTKNNLSNKKIAKLHNIVNREYTVKLIRSSHYMNELIFIYFNSNSISKKKNYNGFAANNLFELCRLIIKIFKFYSENVSIGISRTHSDYKEIKNAYLEAKYSLNYRLLYGWNKWFKYDEYNDNNFVKKEYVQEQLRFLKLAIEKGNEKLAKDILNILIENILKQETISFSIIKDIFLKIEIIFNESLLDVYTDSDIYNQLTIERRPIDDFLSREDVLKYFLNKIGTVCKYIKHKKNNLHYDIIEEMKKYVRENYQSPIYIKELAAGNYFFNQSYLSRLFKKSEGRSFTQYCIAIRMEKAKELLKQDLKVSEVGAFVGYLDISYFIKMFKRIVGITPGDFKIKTIRSPKEN